MEQVGEPSTPEAPVPHGQADRVAAITRALGEQYRLGVGPEGGVAVLGRGGMATVYLGEDARHDRWVAVKVMHPEIVASIGSQRFLREIRIAAQLHHPHILGLIDSGESGGVLWYVMPFVSGESLRSRIEARGAMPVSDVVRLIRDVASALARAHKAGIVHRDIKPENILLEDRHALVTDFGVAKALSDASKVSDTSVGFALGTPAYMAPEQAAADVIDHRADLYALGIVAYEMLTGSLPFDAKTPQQMIAAHMARPPLPLAGKRADIPPALTHIVMRCLEKDPEDRWQSADALLAELDEVPIGTGTHASPTAAYPTQTPAAPTLTTPTPATTAAAAPAEPAASVSPAPARPALGGLTRWIGVAAIAALALLAILGRGCGAAP
ncbi:MAG: serine/threonine-protein kinase [Gemmatimonadales bacterium]